MSKFVDTVVPGFFRALEGILTKRGGRSFSGGNEVGADWGKAHTVLTESSTQMCYADIAVSILVELLTREDELEEAGYGAEAVAALRKAVEVAAPTTAALAASVRRNPGIAAYLAGRPDYPF